mmetsp:Transcript_68443/g.135245  ORF Transcript_68443/g.135245 Transcript_68443/m.135245 type:complete len:201 (-) Transcript_68443:244-846(-)|eukprot:CAMPEP_0172663012 /NCGR_PEP_ID=MMETSP1074-20121228/5665_1 /TAXON_ID=2916 /ORGANISM="Ceratium fusus, Strain PA161109" /LENGTH=200 /DNA_ID=CAMNT_0013478953 /DNA_START=67 /DNA_END=669 /DNA_ORIENTATION=+
MVTIQPTPPVRNEQRRERAKKQRQAKCQRQAAECKERKNREATIEEYGKLQPGKLMPDELKELLTDLADGKAIQDADVNYYLKRFGKPNEESATYVITKNELKRLLNHFSQYVGVMDTTADILAKYDTTKKRALNRDEVRQWMVDANNGFDVTDEEVYRVMMHGDMAQTGQIEAPELNEAVVWWDAQVLNKNSLCGCFQQ